MKKASRGDDYVRFASRKFVSPDLDNAITSYLTISWILLGSCDDKNKKMKYNTE